MAPQIIASSNSQSNSQTRTVSVVPLITFSWVALESKRGRLNILGNGCVFKYFPANRRNAEPMSRTALRVHIRVKRGRNLFSRFNTLGAQAAPKMIRDKPGN